MPSSGQPQHRVLQQTAAQVCSDLVAVTAPAAPLIKPPEIIRAEANLLRFPFFALHTKGLKNFNGVECTGRKFINGKAHTFTLSITRNTKYLYPGPLSRSVHFALLDMLHERGFPYDNPITWKSWGELTDRMEIQPGGSVIAALKDAICRTFGVAIVSNYALTTEIGDKRYPMPTDEHGYSLYNSYHFKNDVLQDGTVMEQHSVEFSTWYIQNLNSRYWGPLDYPTWLALQKVSPIASRGYEFFLFNFTGLDAICIDYATFASFLPIKQERCLSDAKRQLETPFALLRLHDVICDIEWTTGKRGQLQLLITPGLRLVRQAARAATGTPQVLDVLGGMEVRELRASDSPAALIVRKFHELWSATPNVRPLKSEEQYADELIEQYGRQWVERQLPRVVAAMRKPVREGGFPLARYFSAARPFFHTEAKQEEKENIRRQKDEKEAQDEAEHDAKVSQNKAAKKRRRQEAMTIWPTLTPERQAEIEIIASKQQNSEYKKKKFRENSQYRLEECCDALAIQMMENVA